MPYAGLEGRQPGQDFRSVIGHGSTVWEITPDVAVRVETVVVAVGVVEGVVKRVGIKGAGGVKKVATISRIRIMGELGDKPRVSRHFFFLLFTGRGVG